MTNTIVICTLPAAGTLWLNYGLQKYRLLTIGVGSRGALGAGAPPVFTVTP